MISTTDKPDDVSLPEGWDWGRVEAERARWGLADNMVPVAVVPGAAVAWITLGAYRERKK